MYVLAGRNFIGFLLPLTGILEVGVLSESDVGGE